MKLLTDQEVEQFAVVLPSLEAVLDCGMSVKAREQVTSPQLFVKAQECLIYKILLDLESIIAYQIKSHP